MYILSSTNELTWQQNLVEFVLLCYAHLGLTRLNASSFIKDDVSDSDFFTATVIMKREKAKYFLWRAAHNTEKYLKHQIE